MTGDGSYSYAWNGEGLLKSAGTTTYTYDGGDKRVEKSTGRYYWYNPSGLVLAETDTSGNTQNEYIYFNGGPTARRDSSGNVYYYFQDQIGTSRLIATSGGTVCYDADYTPFGYEMAYTTTCSQNYKFTGMERDTETGNDHAWLRNYEQNPGRWLSPDPLGGDITSPQSLNLYGYVMNNPLSNIDPTGQACYAIERGHGGGCDAFMDDGLDFGWDWGRFDASWDCLADPSCWPGIWLPPFPPFFPIPVGGGGGGGGSTGAAGGADLGNSLTLGTRCLSAQVVAQIEADLLALFNSTFGTNLVYDPAHPNGISYQVINGTVTLTVDQPGGTPVTQIPAKPGTPYAHPDFRYDTRPKNGAPSSPGDYGHVLWNVLTPAPNRIANAQVHADIGTFSISKPGATSRHGIRAVFELFQGDPGCAQKFAESSLF
jgi:RHS repeat-associated protein